MTHTVTHKIGQSDCGPPESPVDTFAQCHVGILAKLDTLSELPPLVAAAARARSVSGELLVFFDTVVREHHVEEERDLFPAVVASAAAGDEKARVQRVVDQLKAEHRAIEKAWSLLKPALRRAAAGRPAELDGMAVRTVIDSYRAHAAFEERVFLPLSFQILGRNDNHMAALGTALHLRHALPEVLARFSGRA